MVSLGGQPRRRQKLGLLIMGQGGGFSVRGSGGGRGGGGCERGVKKRRGGMEAGMK